ncbi:MAG: sulfur carrier protein ThiS [Micromonosporaceae bacterium]|nr:sulfur carrier protein ThiS [Micromonosporaceae bacterium]
MTIVVNGAAREVAAAMTLADLLTSILGARRSGIAVAVNGVVLAASQLDLPDRVLVDGDEVEVLTAIQGG